MWGKIFVEKLENLSLKLRWKGYIRRVMHLVYRNGGINLKLVGVKIDNYKSFGEEKNFLYVNDLNTVIGKNESGKSNLLDLLEDVGHMGLSDNRLFFKNNRKSDNPVKVELTFETREDEEFVYHPYKGKVSVILEENDVYKINEEFGKYIIGLPDYQVLMGKIIKLKDTVPITRPESRSKVAKIIEKFENVDKAIFVEPEYWNTFINSMKSLKEPQTEELMNCFEALSFAIDNVYMNFPTFVKIKNLDLKNKYMIDELKKELEKYNDNSILYQLFDICDIDSTRMVDLMEKIVRQA